MSIKTLCVCLLTLPNSVDVCVSVCMYHNLFCQDRCKHPGADIQRAVCVSNSFIHALYLFLYLFILYSVFSFCLLMLVVLRCVGVCCGDSSSSSASMLTMCSVCFRPTYVCHVNFTLTASIG